MTKKLALQILGLPTQVNTDDVRDAYVQYLFTVKQKLLQSPQSSWLMEIQQKRLGQLIEMEEILKIPIECSEDVLEVTSFPDDIIMILRQTEREVASGKLAVSRASCGDDVVMAVQYVLLVLRRYEQAILGFGVNLDIKKGQFDVQTKPLSTADLIGELEGIKTERKIPSPFISSSLENFNIFAEDLPSLCKEYMRLKVAQTKNIIA